MIKVKRVMFIACLELFLYLMGATVQVGAAKKYQDDIKPSMKHVEFANDCNYTAAVYEHVSFTSFIPNITKSGAQLVMKINLDIYEKKVTEAASKGSKIIVFPEYGITGFLLDGTRDNILHYLEIVPNKTAPLVNPCVQEEFQERLVQQRLSCLARHNSIIIVANMASMQLCNKTDDPHCPKNGRYQFNTALSFGAEGQLLAIYHKINLYASESYLFDSGSETESNLGVFDTNFGTFGLFICFDILYDNPAKYFEKFNVHTAVFPTAWMNELPLLDAVEYQQAWALGMQMNVLASNQHMPLVQMTGSGIFSGSEGAVVYTYDMDSMKGKLLVGQLPCYPKHVRNQISIGDESLHKINEWNDIPKFDNMESNINHNISTKQYLKIIDKKMKNLSRTFALEKKSSIKDNDTFTSLVNDDPYTLKLLMKEEGAITVQDNNLSCHLNYSLHGAWNPNDWYALGVFDGLHTMNGQYFIQACVLIRCASTQKSQCGAETSQSHTKFKSFSLQIVNYNQRTFLTPEILTTGVQLPQRGLAWETNTKYDRIWVGPKGLEEPLLMTGLYGRLYSHD